ncbi:MAG: DNA methyltransferase [Chloroflexota bacterium]|nr:site-specific DNA-methyltransferase [Chloroflexota bacterium]
MSWKVIKGDCLEAIKENKIANIDLIYLDPPFGTQKEHTLLTRDGKSRFSYSDIWSSKDEYFWFIHERVTVFRELLKETGSLFFHCDTTSSHIIRLILDDVFGSNNFRSEIIWYYKRWTNSQKGLIPAHQTIFFYSKTNDFKFNSIYSDYSETTNVEQILQKRERDARGKSVYAVDEEGEYIINGTKKGVAINDVWEIPYLNPKAKERVGYPTQKPITLLERIINLASDPGDLIFDPFCGSGTTLVAASLCGRNSIGVDLSEEACELSTKRLNDPFKSHSLVMNLGREKYLHKDAEALSHLSNVEYTVVARNKGIDALLKEEINGHLVFVRVQRENETISEAISAIIKATEKKGACYMVVIKTNSNNEMFDKLHSHTNLIVIPSFSYQFKLCIETQSLNGRGLGG